MNPLEIPTKDSLKTWLPPRVYRMLQLELEDWERKAPERLKDEASMRYLFMSVLQTCQMECPHPWRKQVHEREPITGMFECRMCKAIWISNDRITRYE